MKNEMFEERYVVFSGWSERYWRTWPTGPPKEPKKGASEAKWNDYTERRDEYDHLYYNEPKRVPEMEERPKCDEEDLAAFHALLRKIGQAVC